VAGLFLIRIAGGRTDKIESTLLDGVAAYVNERPITVGDVLVAMEPKRRQLVGKFSGEELSARLKEAYQQALAVLIDQRLIREAYERENRRLPDWAVDQRINEILHDKFADDRSQLLAELAAAGLTYEDWRREIENQLIVATMRHAYVDRHVYVSPSAVRTFYETSRDRYLRPSKVKLRLIVINKKEAAEPAAQRERADAALKRIRAGEDFAAVAAEVSEDKKAAAGGDWGWTEVSLLKPELAQVAMRLESGEVSDVVESEDSFYILKCEGREQESMVPFEEVRATIQRELEKQEAERLYREWVNRLRAQASIQVLETNPFE